MPDGWRRRVPLLICPAVFTPISFRVSTRRSPRVVATALLGLISLLSARMLPAQESTVAHVEAAKPVVLPAAFFKDVPESIADLQAMEQHVGSLVPQLKACTVAVEVGRAQGSGVIVSEDGYVLTAAHVSGQPGLKAVFILPDGRRVFGRTLGHNNSLDASLMKIDADGTIWPHAEMSKPGALHTGDWCVVTGHPGGFQAGRAPVVRVGRVIAVDDHDIQTDCELVGGDSGGPLFDMYGRVIGINSRIGPSTSLNLHVPVAAYEKDWDRLVASENFTSHSGALLGVQGEDDERGVKLTHVDPRNPAGLAGLREGDILTTFQGVKVHTIAELIQLVGEESPGRRIKLEVLRDGQSQRFDIELGQRNG